MLGVRAGLPGYSRFASFSAEDLSFCLARESNTFVEMPYGLVSALSPVALKNGTPMLEYGHRRRYF